MSHEWSRDLQNAAGLISRYAVRIQSSGHRQIISRFLARWGCDNAACEPATGPMDAGEVLPAGRPSDIAIAAASAVLDKPDPLSAAAEFVGRYHRLSPLTEAELEPLFHFICLKLCRNVVKQAMIAPGEERISEAPEWPALKSFAEVHPRLAHYTLRHACGFEPCPDSPAVVSWLQDYGGSPGFASIVGDDLKGCGAVVLDLSADSSELGKRETSQDIESYVERTRARLRMAGAKAALGRYNEVRSVYTGDQYRRQGNDGPEYRTVHTGIDVFMEAGSPVYAPLDGYVHSFRNNAAPLDYGPTIILRHPVPSAGTEFYTLYGHLNTDSLENLSAGIPVRRGERIAKIGTSSENGGWAPHVHLQIVVDMLDLEGDFPGVASPRHLAVWLSLSPDPNLILGIPADRWIIR